MGKSIKSLGAVPKHIGVYTRSYCSLSAGFCNRTRNVCALPSDAGNSLESFRADPATISCDYFLDS